MSLHPISDKAEVSVDFPDKAYMGGFGRHSQFGAYADADSVAIRLVRPGEDRLATLLLCAARDYDEIADDLEAGGTEIRHTELIRE